MKCRLVIELGCVPCDEFPQGKKPAGTVIEHPDAYRLVLKGVAEAVDDECREAAPTTPRQAVERLNSYLKLAAGITPEDRAAWDKGYMRGYNPDGTWKPGPNAAEFEQEEWEEYKKNSRLALP